MDIEPPNNDSTMKGVEIPFHRNLERAEYLATHGMGVVVVCLRTIRDCTRRSESDSL